MKTKGVLSDVIHSGLTIFGYMLALMPLVIFLIFVKQMLNQF